jgi:hypothetical protein
MSRSRTYRPRVECLESRLVPSTFTVKNLLDDGSAGSLRMRIEAANNRPGADTVVFKPGLEGTIPLNGTEILISDSLVLAGPGAAKVTVDGNAASRIFFIYDFTAVDKNVTVRGLTLFNGKGSLGGASITLKT